MVHRKNAVWLAAAGMGLAAGLFFGGLCPNAPLHAVCTDRSETYAMATGPVDSDIEAVYFLDFLTGDLEALVLGKMPGTWNGRFHTNVSADLGVDPQKNPKYMMVTGVTDLRRAGGTRQQPSSAVCYVAEVTTGKVVAYAIPWSQSMHAAGQLQEGALAKVGIPIEFRHGAGGPLRMGPPTGAQRPKSR